MIKNLYSVTAFEAAELMWPAPKHERIDHARLPLYCYCMRAAAVEPALCRRQAIRPNSRRSKTLRQTR